MNDFSLTNVTVYISFFSCNVFKLSKLQSNLNKKSSMKHIFNLLEYQIGY